VRTRKISVLLTNDIAAQYDMLVATLGVGAKYRKQSDIDAAMLSTLLEQYSAILSAHSGETGKNWCTPGELIAFRESVLRDSNAHRAGMLQHLAGSVAEGESAAIAQFAESHA